MAETYPIQRNGYTVEYDKDARRKSDGRVFGVKCDAYPDTVVEITVKGSAQPDAPTLEDLEARLEQAAKVTPEWGTWWAGRKKQ